MDGVLKKRERMKRTSIKQRNEVRKIGSEDGSKAREKTCGHRASRSS